MGEIRVMLPLFYGISVLQNFRPTILPTYVECTLCQSDPRCNCSFSPYEVDSATIRIDVPTVIMQMFRLHMQVGCTTFVGQMYRLDAQRQGKTSSVTSVEAKFFIVTK